MKSKMGIADKVKQQRAPTQEGNTLGKEENLDVDIAEGLGMKMLESPEAQQVLGAAMDGSGDPAAKLGTFFAQLIDKIQTKMDTSPIPLSPRIWLSEGGVLDRWVAGLTEKGLVPEGIIGPVKDEVMEVLKLQEQSVKQGGPPNEQAPPPQQQPQPAAPPPQPMMGGMPA